MLTVQNLAAQEDESKYREAYDSWCKEANGNWIPLWFRTDGEYPPLREAYVRLFEIGAKPPQRLFPGPALPVRRTLNCSIG